MKKCPLLEKYFVNEDDAGYGHSCHDWKKRICSECPLQVCVLDRPGRKIHPMDKEILERKQIPCPKCRMLALKKDSEGDWHCYSCGNIIFKDKPLKFSLQGGANRQHGYE